MLGMDLFLFHLSAYSIIPDHDMNLPLDIRQKMGDSKDKGGG